MRSSCKILLVNLVALAIAFGGVSVRAQSQRPATPISPARPGVATATASPSAARQTPSANRRGVVWVSTDTGVYHKLGTR